MRIIFFSKMFKIWSRFKNFTKKVGETFLCVRELHLNWLRLIVPLRKEILVIGSPYVNKQSERFTYHYERLFPTKFHCYWSLNMWKMLLGTLRHCLRLFNMLLVEKSSQMSIFRHLPNHVCQSVISETHNLWRSSFFSK